MRESLPLSSCSRPPALFLAGCKSPTRHSPAKPSRRAGSQRYGDGASSPRPLEQLFLPPQISERPDVGNDQGDAELVLRAHLPKGQAAILDRDSAAGAVVADLHQLILQVLLLNVVAHAKRGVPAPAVQVAVSHQRANLICERLQNAVVVDGEMRHRKIEILIWANFQQSARGREPLAPGVIFQANLRVIIPAGRYAEIAIDRRKVSWLLRERERRDRIERLQNVPRSGNERAIKGWVEEILLRYAPAHQLVGLSVSRAVKQTLRDRIHEFICVGHAASVSPRGRQT